MFGKLVNSRLWRTGMLAAAVAALDMTCTAPARADAFDDLVSSGADNYAVFELDANAVKLSAVTVNGNVAVASGGRIMNMAPSTIADNVYESGSAQYRGPGRLLGKQVVNSSALLMNYDGALQAATEAAIAAPTQTIYGNITGARTFTAAAGQTVVIDLNGNINLNNANLTLSGTSASHFIVNIAGNLSLTGTASLLNVGVPLSNILYNFTGGAGAGSVNTHVGDTIDGIMLAASGCAGWTLGGTFHGELISSCGVTLESGAHTNGRPPLPVPEPSALLILASGLLGFGWLARRRPLQ